MFPAAVATPPTETKRSKTGGPVLLHALRPRAHSQEWVRGRFRAFYRGSTHGVNASRTIRSEDATPSRLFRMDKILLIIIVIAIILALVGGLVKAVNFLLWVGLALLIISVIAWLLRSLTGRRR